MYVRMLPGPIMGWPRALAKPGGKIAKNIPHDAGPLSWQNGARSKVDGRRRK
jgi:hypothetical protein